MKKKNRIVIWISVAAVVVIGLVYGYFRVKNYITNLEEEMIKRRAQETGSTGETTKTVSNEIVFSGKVAPKMSQTILLSAAKTLSTVYVEEMQNVKKGDVLLLYAGGENIDDLIRIQKNKFVQWNIDRHWYQEKLAELRQELEWADANDDAYVSGLKTKIADYDSRLALLNVNWNNALNEIDRLVRDRDNYAIKAEFDGFVYSIDDNAKMSPATPYMILYSTERIVTIQVGEYELRYIELGKATTITIEGLDKTYSGTISKIDIMPNNITSNDTSYFNIEISIPADVPYGYSAVIAVKTAS